MTSPRPTLRRRVLANLVRVALVVGVVPLMAPTCGTMAPGIKSFSRQSLIIPTDVCYQSMSDSLHRDSNGTGYVPFSCPQAKASGDTIKAYGLVYELIKANIAVYWIINPSKAATTDVDFSIQYNGGPPVFGYDWVNGRAATTSPTSGHKIDYRGGPFVVDGSDFTRAVQVLSQYRSTFSTVNVHVSNVAFQAYVAKTMAGGWSAGGSVPPKLALLDIGSDGAGAKNSEPVIQGYLTRAGLDTAGAAGYADPNKGIHGQIYDRLVMNDFLPQNGGGWQSSYLGANGYQVLWVPHWAAPSSCSDCSGLQDNKCTPQPACNPCPCKSKFSASTIASALSTMGSFSAAGNDVFAECAGLGSFEGVFTGSTSTSSFNSTYGAGGALTHFETASTPPGVWINLWPQNSSHQDLGSDSAIIRTGYSSPLMQIGDYPFVAQSGAIEDYRPQAYKPGVVQFISDGTNPTYDVFSMLPPAAGGHGTIVYLAGHSYSGTDGNFEVSGARLVLNTLFNLGAACQETGVACNTGLLGECAQGVMSCDANGQPYCKQIVFPTNEVCDGKDNDCNGLIDDGLDVACYDGPASTRNVGLCHDGVSSCVELADGSHVMSACSGEVTPSTEICNGLDDACTGHPDQILVSGTWTPLSGSCYTGPNVSLDPTTGQPRGICKAGIATCTAGTWSACPTAGGTSPADAGCPDNAWLTPASYPNCQILPRQQICGAGGTVNGQLQDMSCSGTINCGCTEGATQPCYDGPPESVLNTGQPGQTSICKRGTRTCSSGVWGECDGEVLPQERDCTSALDNNCNGTPDKDEAACNTCPPAGDPALVCPIPNACPGTNSNGTACAVAWIAPVNGDPACTSSATCTSGKKCIDGFCRSACTPGTAGCVPAGTCQNGTRACSAGVLGACSGGILPSVEVCDGKDNNCNGEVDEHPDQLCGPGFTCTNGACVPQSCDVESFPREGYHCVGGVWTPDACPTNPCAPGLVCENGTCVDKCAGVQCGQGDICTTGLSGGACTGGGCYLAGCPGGQVCKQGTCAPDPCAGLTCPSGTFCRAGDCVQSCVYVKCASGQICGQDGFCLPDLCASVHCTPGSQKCVSDGTTARCVADLCEGKSCGARQTCVDGVCEDDPCDQVQCGVGVCNSGQCYPATVRDTSSASTSSSAGGCGCGSGSGGGLAGLLLLFLYPLVRRRVRQPAVARAGRRGARGAGLLLVLAVLALSASACKKGSSSVDLSACKETCGEQQCIDLNYDPAHCGRCDTSCGASQQCVDGVCGPTSDVAPRLTALSPDQGNHGQLTPVTVSLTGQRFVAGAEVRAISPAGTATFPLDGCSLSPQRNCVLDASHATVDLDLSDTPITTLDLRLVNPDHVISNAVQFDVTSAAAHLDDIADLLPDLTLHRPATVTTGQVGNLVVTGTQFSATSICRAAASPQCGGASGYVTLSTVAGPGAGQLTCTLDATALPPGVYDVWVDNDGLDSNCLGANVVSAQPHLTSLSPGSGQTGAVMDVGVVGSGFDATSVVFFTWNGGTPENLQAKTTYVDPTHLVVSQYTLKSGSAQVTVQNGTAGTPSNALTFSAVASPPQVSGLSVYPTALGAGHPAYQGDAVTLSFTGSNLYVAGAGGTTPTGITIVPPSGATFGATLGAYTAGSVLGTASLSGKPAGVYNAFLTFNVAGSTVTSSSLPFRVLSNVAVLSSASPAGGQQGTVKAVVLTASNLHGTGTTNVLFTNTSGFSRTVAASSVVPPTTVNVSLDLTGLATGVYALAVQNPGAAASNQISFSITPGQPTLSTVAVNGGAASAAGCVVQSDTAANITLTGTNFAKPDAQGNGGSQVMISPDGGATWIPAPATVTVASASQITATFDTRSAPGDLTYPIQVWNPPGPMKSAQSVTLKVSTSTCP